MFRTVKLSVLRFESNGRDTGRREILSTREINWFWREVGAAGSISNGLPFFDNLTFQIRTFKFGATRGRGANRSSPVRTSAV